MLTSDWHIHSRNSCDCRHGEIPTTMAETVAAIEAHGIRDYGITDHLHTAFNWPDIQASRQEFLALPPSPHRHFGIEVSCVSQWELDQVTGGTVENPVYGIRAGGPPDDPLAIALTEEMISECEIEYVVGGTHWLLYVPMEREQVMRNYHRQNLYLACHPLVTIVAHPWWWMGHWQEDDGVYRTAPWFDDFRCIPQSLHDEFASAVLSHGKIVEINVNAVLLTPNYPDAFKRQYCNYLAGLKAAGVLLSLGSDHHAQHHHYGDADFERVEAMLESVGITAGDLCTPIGERAATSE